MDVMMWAISSILFCVGCADQSVIDPAATAMIAKVDVTAPQVTLAPGEHTTLTATPRDDLGELVEGQVVSWSTSDPAVAEVESTGATTAKVTGLAVGSATITASVGNVSGQALATVATSEPAPEGDPEPDSNDRILFDTRTSLQTATSLQGALGLFEENPGPWAFTTNMDGRGTHALRVDWSGMGSACGDAAALIIKRLPTPYAKRIYIQWKMHMGRTATGGGIGEVGRFQITNSACGNAGRKMINVLRDVPDGGGTGRIDLLWHGPAPVHPGFAAGRAFEGNLWPNTGASYVPEALIGKDVTHTIYLQAESSPGASDGIVRMWVNGVLVFDHTGVATNADAFQRFQIPSTFRAPAIDQSEYFWDILVWEAK